MEGRNRVFQELKPPCVALSQAALTFSTPRGNKQDVEDTLNTVLHALKTVTRTTSSFDSKLADYVFFPLSQVLKASQRLSVRALELSLQCIAVLIREGWQQLIASPLAAQLLILCTLMAEKKPAGLGTDQTTDELQLAAFDCLAALFAALRMSDDGRTMLTETANVPSLGQAITTILDGIDAGASMEIQLTAMTALENLVGCVDDTESLASFLPGIVSRLTKVLTPATNGRRNHKVLVGCINILCTTIQATVSDDVVSRLLAPCDEVVLRSNTNLNVKKLDVQWLETTTTQLKPALYNVFRLRTYARSDVKVALARLCFTVLQHCRKSLANCSTSALEALITISSDASDTTVKHQLAVITQSDSSLVGLLQEILHDWLGSLTTIMQSRDDITKVQRIQQISTLHHLLNQSGIDIFTIDRMLAKEVRDSVVLTLQLPSTELGRLAPVQSIDIAAMDSLNASKSFSSALVRYKGQEAVLGGIGNFAMSIGMSRSFPAFAAVLVRSLRTSSGDTQVADFWLSLEAVKSAVQPDDEIGQLLEFDGTSRAGSKISLEELYSFSLSLLSETDSEQPPDQRLQRLALQTLALQASISGDDFRYELVDALYPVLHTLATPDESLQRDAMTCLDIIASSCAYTDVKQLIAENVDYLTNAVALKLNAFDVSPQAPLVLLMMVRLAGPSLLPYLEDTVGSIFAALEDFHGYPVLVELLFRVLSVIAEEGVKAPLLAIEYGERCDGMKVQWRPTSVATLANMIREHSAEKIIPEDSAENGSYGTSFPHRPWKAAEEVVEDDDRHSGTKSQKAEDDEDAEQTVEDQEAPPPAPRIYTLLLKITELTQHYLSSASPSLRTSLLSLIRTTVPAISKHENSFLPLINTLWPEIVSRLDGSEPHVVAAALDIVSILCEYAGDFMRSRITSLWPEILAMHQRITRDITGIADTHKAGQITDIAIAKAVARLSRDPSRFVNTASRHLWKSFTGFLVAVVHHVPTSADITDDTLQMLEPLLDESDVLEAVREQNPDAVWLIRVRAGDIAVPQAPEIPFGKHWQFPSVPG